MIDFTKKESPEIISRPPLYYQAVTRVLSPAYRMKVWQKSHKQDNYKREVADRFGRSYKGHLFEGQQDLQALGESAPIIWCHAVSLGETNTIAPILKELMAYGYKIWLTSTTQTGFNRCQDLFAKKLEQGVLFHSFVPVDRPNVIKKFLNYVNPKAALFVETELWANTLYELAYKDIPAILVNARLSAVSYVNYKKVGKLSRSMMHNLSLIIAQDDLSAQRYRWLGAAANKIRVAGSLKWTVTDAKNANQWKVLYMTRQAIGNRPIWVAASTHEGEEDVALTAHKQLIQNAKLANALLILVPRHPERFDVAFHKVLQTKLNYHRRSIHGLPTEETQVYLADTMGELMLWYQLADVAFVGGSLVNNGGHNPIESYIHSTPVIMGQFTQTCQGVIDSLLQQKAMYQIHANYQHTKGNELAEETVDELSKQMMTQLDFWLSNPQQAHQAGKKGQALVEDNQATLQRQLDMILDCIEPNRHHPDYQ